MRFCVPALACLLACPCVVPVCAQQHDQLYTASREQLDVTKVVLAQQHAWNDGNLDEYLKYFKDAPDTTVMLNAPVHGLEAIRNSFRTNFPNKATMGTLEQTEVEVRELGENFALATGRYHLNRGKKEGGPVDGTFSEIMEKTPAGWRIIFSENT